MRKNNPLLRLMTIFMAVIGLSAATLSIYILISSLFSVNPSRKNTDHFSEVITAQTNNLTKERIFSPDTDQSYDILPENQESESAMPNYTPVNQVASEDSSENENISENQESQYSISEQNVYEESTPIQSVPEPSDPLLNTDDTLISEQNIPESEYQSNTDSNLSGSAGNAENFNTYYNPYLQQTDAAFVLNTSSLVFHLPKCNDVAKMAEKNYATSNDSFEYIQAQGYKPCGHCLKDYPYGNSWNSVENYIDNSYDSNTSDNSNLQQDTNTATYIINTKTRYFHLPNGCKYINNYSDPEDCVPTNSSIDELRSQNYIPCRHCFG